MLTSRGLSLRWAQVLRNSGSVRGLRMALTMALGALAISTALAQADAYPTRPIRMIVAFAHGGASDQTARMISEPFSRVLGHPIIV